MDSEVVRACSYACEQRGHTYELVARDASHGVRRVGRGLAGTAGARNRHYLYCGPDRDQKTDSLPLPLDPGSSRPHLLPRPPLRRDRSGRNPPLRTQGRSGIEMEQASAGRRGRSAQKRKTSEPRGAACP